MLRDVLSIGDKIDVKRLDRMGKPLTRVNTYVSQIADIVDINVIHIAAPIKGQIMMNPEAGECYNLCFYTKNGLYQCSCVVLNTSKENNTVIVEVKITSDLEKFQRRQYYRLECINEMQYHPISREEEIFKERLLNDKFEDDKKQEECKLRLQDLEDQWFNASITNISGGGVKFNSSQMHNEGEKIRIKLDFVIFESQKKLDLGAVIIASNRSMNRYGVYENRAEFSDITKRDREDLIRYIFEQERRLRKNYRI